MNILITYTIVVIRMKKKKFAYAFEYIEYCGLDTYNLQYVTRNY